MPHKSTLRLDPLTEKIYETSPLLMGILEFRNGKIIHLQSTQIAQALFQFSEPKETEGFFSTWIKYCEQAVERKYTVRFQEIFEHATQGQRHLEITLTEIQNTDDQRGQLLAWTASDNTEHVRFKQAIEGSNEGLWSWDAEHDHIYFSDVWKSVLGYKPDEISSDFVEWQNRIHPEDLDLFVNTLQNYIENRIPEFRIVYRLKHKDTRYRWILCRGGCVRNAQGKLVRMVGMHMDISDQKRTEALLSHQKEILTSIARSQSTYLVLSEVVHLIESQIAGSKIVVTKYDSEKQKFLIYTAPSMPQEFINRAQEGFSNELEIAAAQHLGIHPFQCIPIKNLHSQILGSFQVYVASPLDQISEQEAILLDTAVQLASVAMEKEHAQQELEVERMKSFTASKMSTLGEMASGIAHEINNPLAIILGKTTLIKSQIKKGTSTQASIFADLDRVSATAMRISKIVRGLRAFSRNAENDPFVANALEPIIEDTLELCTERYKQHKVHLNLKISKNINLDCRAAQIAQVILNLLNNAHDAVLGTVDPWVELEAFQKDDRIIIYVTDSGKGIPKSIADKIMQPFFTTKGVGSGTGLGLSISKGIIEDHQGKLSLDTRYPNTRFIIDLPVKQPHPVQEQDADTEKATQPYKKAA